MAEEARLESVYTSKAYPGFESRSLRKKNRWRIPQQGVFSIVFFIPSRCSDQRQALVQRHSGERTPLIRAARLVVEIVKVVHVAIRLHLEGIEIVGRIACAPPVAQRFQRVPSIQGIEEEP